MYAGSLSFSLFLTEDLIAKKRVTVKDIYLESRHSYDYTCSSDLTFPVLAVGAQQPATIDPALDLCTRFPYRLSGLRQYGIRSLPDTSTRGQHWESNSRPSELESNALSTGSHAPQRRLD